jgi:hypothetical protein
MVYILTFLLGKKRLSLHTRLVEEDSLGSVDVERIYIQLYLH